MNYSSMTIPQLRTIAKRNQIDIRGKYCKAEIVNQIVNIMTKCTADLSLIGQLPIEILVKIILKLDMSDITKLCQVNKILASIGADDYIWSRIFKRDYIQYECNKPIMNTWRQTIMEYTRFSKLKYNYDNFIKVYKQYTRILDEPIRNLIQKYHFRPSVWITFEESGYDCLYMIKDCYVDMEADQNKYSLHYIIEECIVDMIYMATRDQYGKHDPLEIKRQLNDQYFHHKSVLPIMLDKSDILYCHIKIENLK